MNEREKTLFKKISRFYLKGVKEMKRRNLRQNKQRGGKALA